MDRCPTMADSFGMILKTFGSAAEPFINIERFWQDERTLDDRRKSIEKLIQDTYVPGFRFSSNKHFLWHFFERDDPFLILRGRPPDRYYEQWLRAIMVPRPLDYRAEIAAAMIAGENRYKRRLQSRGHWDQSWTWQERVKRVLQHGGVLSCDRSVVSVNERSIYRWAQEAPGLRAKRLASTPPSGWRIWEILLEGDLDARYGTEADHILSSKELDKTPFYRETWVWAKDCEGPQPHCNSWTFSEPAPFVLWQKPWLSKRTKQHIVNRRR